MKEQWVPMTPEMQAVIIAATLREGQLELAQQKIKEISRPPFWIHSLYIHALCERKDFEAALHYMYRLQDQRIHLPRPMWSHLLRQASQHGHFDLTYRIWLFHIEPMYIIPDADCCVQVLELASKHASPRLAESAMAILEDRHPEVVEKHRHLLDTTYDNAKQTPDATRYRRGNLFHALPKALGHHEAFFDPKIALAKRPLKRFLNPKRLERKEKERAWSRRR
jgi:hypothetical protein